jgi:DNA repair exonuclease SbcCD ATPase subunit
VAGDHDVESSRQKKLKWFFQKWWDAVPHNYQTTNEMNAEQTTTTRKLIKRPAMKLKTLEEVVERPPSPAPAHESESDSDETVSVKSEPCGEDHDDAETQTTFSNESAMSREEVKEIVRVYCQEDLKTELYEGMGEELRKLDEQVAENMESERRQMEETFEERLADLRREMEESIAQKLATLAGGHATIQKQTKKAEKEKKKEEEVKGYYAVPAGVDEIARLRKINAELRKESEGKSNTNRKLQERIDALEGEDPVATYAQEIKRIKEVNQVLRKRCEAKDRTYQKMKAMIEALGGKAPAEE